MTATREVEAPASPDTHRTIAKRLEALGWGLFLMMTGFIWLVPEQQVPPGTWLMGTGVLLLALNGVRYLKGIGVSGFTTFLGAVAFTAGVCGYFGVRLPLVAIGLIAIGGAIILKPFLARTT